MIRKLREGKRRRLLEVDNVHVADCGEPPDLDAADYLGYFENRHGEQWVFMGDREAKTAVLFGGDAGWGERREMTADRMMPDMMMGQDERWWLVTCWAAMLTENVDTVVKRWDEQAKEFAANVARQMRDQGKIK